MSTLSSVREFARPATSSFTFGRAVALLAGVVAVGFDTIMTRAELAKSRRQLACATSGSTGRPPGSSRTRATGPEGLLIRAPDPEVCWERAAHPTA